MKNINFICLGPKKNHETIGYLQSACRKHQLRFVLIDDTEINKKIKAKKNDIVFRIGTSEQFKQKEKEIISSQTVAFYKSYSVAQKYTGTNLEQVSIHKKHRIPIPKYLAKVPKNPDRQKTIKKFSFPVVVKAGARQYKGVGVIQIDSFTSLMSLINYLEYINQPYIIKEFIKISRPVYSIRSVVIGSQIDFSYKMTNHNKDEFRSHCNSNKIVRKIITVPDKDKKILIKSVQVLGLELGAVDYVYDQKGDIKIFEVNFPFNFSRIVENFNYPIHEKMVDYLVNKSKALS